MFVKHAGKKNVSCGFHLHFVVTCLLYNQGFPDVLFCVCSLFTNWRKTFSFQDAIIKNLLEISCSLHDKHSKYQS